MTGVDTNILVYSHRTEMPLHKSAARCVRELAEGRAPWAIPWPCIHEFLAIVTNSRIYRTPTPLLRALAQVEAWLASPSLVVLPETDTHWHYLKETLVKAGATGGMTHDARIAAICMQHRVGTFYTVDRDFTRFSGLRTVNPLIP